MLSESDRYALSRVTHPSMPGLYRAMTEMSRQQLFTELFEAYYTKVLAYVRRRVGADAANDVVAETFRRRG